MHYRCRGFTLVELLVVVSIIGIIGSLIFFNIGEGSAQARDAQRQADLRNVETALELYRQKYGRYPERCISSDAQWSGHAGDFACVNGTNEYIAGLAPEFLSTLPIDPRPQGTNSGYVYTVNGDGTVYKFMALRTVESEVVTIDHPFKSCDISTNLTGVPCSESDIPPEVGSTCFSRSCDWVKNESPNPPNRCRVTEPRFQTSYAVWGGLGQPAVAPNNSSYDIQLEERTEVIVCR